MGEQNFALNFGQRSADATTDNYIFLAEGYIPHRHILAFKMDRAVYFVVMVPFIVILYAAISFTVKSRNKPLPTNPNGADGDSTENFDNEETQDPVPETDTRRFRAAKGPVAINVYPHGQASINTGDHFHIHMSRYEPASGSQASYASRYTGRFNQNQRFSRAQGESRGPPPVYSRADPRAGTESAPAA